MADEAGAQVLSVSDVTHGSGPESHAVDVTRQFGGTSEDLILASSRVAMSDMWVLTQFSPGTFPRQTRVSTDA